MANRAGIEVVIVTIVAVTKIVIQGVEKVVIGECLVPLTLLCMYS